LVVRQCPEAIVEMLFMVLSCTNDMSAPQAEEIQCDRLTAGAQMSTMEILSMVPLAAPALVVPYLHVRPSAFCSFVMPLKVAVRHKSFICAATLTYIAMFLCDVSVEVRALCEGQFAEVTGECVR
jgi:hypothetical protein